MGTLKQADNLHVGDKVWECGNEWTGLQCDWNNVSRIKQGRDGLLEIELRKDQVLKFLLVKGPTEMVRVAA
jgi:hypothetical protein